MAPCMGLPQSLTIASASQLLFAVICTLWLDTVRSSTMATSHNPITKMVNPGDRLDIPCSVMSPGGSVQWVRNGKAILLDFARASRLHWNISGDGQASVTINRVTKNDEGLWECWELDSQGNPKQKAQVMKLLVANVPEDPYLEVDGKRLDPGAPFVLTAREKGSLTLRCIVTGASPAVRRISWFLGETNVTHWSQLLMEYRAEEDNYDAQSLLVVNVTKELHGKMATCQAEHIAWQRPAVAGASLNVLYEPSFSISREPGFGYPIIDGMGVSLKCDIDANPRSRAKWIKDGDVNQSKFNPSQPLPPEPRTGPEGELNISTVSMADAGWYRCVTDHEFGHFASFGYYLNVRAELPKLQHVLKLPLSPPHWVANSINKESRELLPRQHLQGSASSAAAGSAHLLEAGGAKSAFQASASVSGGHSMDIMVNSGFYPGGNQHQQQTNSLQALIERQQGCPDANGKPVVVATNRTVQAFVGRPVSLSAEFCCNPRPKRVYWIFRHLAMAPGRVIGPYVTKDLSPTSNSRNCYTSTFDIDAVKPEDAGEILIIVSNAKGMDECAMWLNVTRAGFSISRAKSPVPCCDYYKWSLLLLLVIVGDIMVLE